MRRVLIISQQREMTEEIAAQLGSQSFGFQSALDLDSAMHKIKAWKPHLVILSMKLDGSSLPEIIGRIRHYTSEEYTSILLLASRDDLSEIFKALELGADDYLVVPFESYDLQSRIRVMLKVKENQDALRRAMHRIEELSSTDELTGLLNMRAIYRKGEEEINRAKRFRKPLAAVLLNIDGFSHVNQTFGFEFGNFVLQEVGARIKECVRSVDHIGRFGADEFFLILTETDLASAEFIAERLRDAIQAEPFKSEKQSVRLTASLGVAGITHEQTQQRLSGLLHITTEALKSAEANGMNRTEVYSFT